jgi:hypothetical protein
VPCRERRCRAVIAKRISGRGCIKRLACPGRGSKPTCRSERITPAGRGLYRLGRTTSGSLRMAGSTHAGQQASHPSGNGIRGQAGSLSLVAFGGRTGEIAVLTTSSNRSNSTSVIALFKFKRAEILTSTIAIFPQIIDAQFGVQIESFCSLRRDRKKDRLCQKLFKQVTMGRSAPSRHCAAISTNTSARPFHPVI